MSDGGDDGIGKGQILVVLSLVITMTVLRDQFAVENAIFFTLCALIAAVAVFKRNLLRTPFNLVFLALLSATFLFLRLSGVNEMDEFDGRFVDAITFVICATWFGILYLAGRLTNRRFLEEEEDIPSDRRPPLDQ